MKSVIAQGSTICKAIEEALKKANMPTEFFIKLLEDAQGGFLGFGAKKAKIALFFKESVNHGKKETILPQSSYENLFNNHSIKQQIDQQLKQTEPKSDVSHQPKHKPQQKQEKTNDHSKNLKHHQKPHHTRSNQRPYLHPKHTKPEQNRQETQLKIRPLPPKNNDKPQS